MILSNTGLESISINRPIEGAAKIPDNVRLATSGLKIENHTNNLFVTNKGSNEIINFVIKTAANAELAEPITFNSVPKKIIAVVRKIASSLPSGSPETDKINKGLELLSSIDFNIEVIKLHKLQMQKG
jgi:hypothetical protein